MKLLFKFLFAIIIIGVFSCQENRKDISKHEEIKKADSVVISDEEIDKIRMKELDAELEKAKEQAYNLAIADVGKRTVIYDYESIITRQNLRVEIEYGNIFDKDKAHTIIHVVGRYLSLVGIYYYNNIEVADSLQTLLFFTRYHIGNNGDTIQDVNGDDRKDFILKSYPMSGCCLAELRDVYLFQTATKFTEKYDFINPTFYPKEKVIRGLTYGWNPLLYKYKWNKLEIDTIEYIVPNLIDTTRSTFYRTKKWQDPNDMEKINKTKLNSIPKEYYSIDNFDVFLRR